MKTSSHVAAGYSHPEREFDRDETTEPLPFEATPSCYPGYRVVSFLTDEMEFSVRVEKSDTRTDLEILDDLIDALALEKARRA